MQTLLTSRYGLQADCTRMIHFQVDLFAQAEALHLKLSSHLNARGCPFQCSLLVTFNVPDSASVDLIHCFTDERLRKGKPLALR
jgi:hypothetical protein